MRENFLTKAIPFTLLKEGGFSNNPKDPGGPTFKGVCLRDFPELKDKIMGKSLTDEEAAQLVYLPKYWVPAGCDSLLYPLDCVVFDMAVNMGNVRSREAAADAHKITDHLEGLFMALGAYCGTNHFPFAWPSLAAAVHIAERIGEYNIMGGGRKYRIFRNGWRNRAFDSLKTFL